MIYQLAALRSKSRSSGGATVTLPNTKLFEANGTFTGTQFGSGGPIVIPPFTESIRYTVRARGQKAFLSNKCLHTKTSSVYGDPSCKFFKVVISGTGGRYYEDYTVHPKATTAHASAQTLAKTAFGLTMDSAVLGSGGLGYVNDAFKRIRPDLTTVSVPNFLADIDDLKTLFQLWKKSVSLAKNVAGAHLNYKFGIKPTIGDVSDMLKGVLSLQNKLRAFEEALGGIIKDRVTLLSDTTNRSGSVSNFVNTGDTLTWSGALHRTVKGHMSWTPQPLAVMGGMDKILRGLADSLGFELNPRIVWDALPFTFVLDWFFGIGGWLDNFKLDTLELPIRLLDSCLTYKQELVVTSQLTCYQGTINSVVSCPRWETRENYFERMPIFPDFATFQGLGWRMPTLNQWELMLSLATVLGKNL